MFPRLKTGWKHFSSERAADQTVESQELERNQLGRTVLLIALTIISVTFAAIWWLFTAHQLGSSWHLCAGVFKGLWKDTALPGSSEDARRSPNCSNTKHLPNISTWISPGSLICGSFWTETGWSELHSSPTVSPKHSSLSVRQVPFEATFGEIFHLCLPQCLNGNVTLNNELTGQKS